MSSTNGHPAAASEPAQVAVAPAVTLGDGYLTIEGLTVHGTPVDAARVCAECGENLEVAVRQMLEIGATVVLHGGNQATIDAARSEVDRLLQAVTQTVTENLPRTVNEQLGAFRQVLGQYMDAERADSVQRQLEKILRDGAGAQRQELTKALLDERGPLGLLKAELSGPLKSVHELVPHVVALKERLDAAERIGGERERGTSKGIDYEAAVGDILAAGLAPFHDTVDRVGTELGADRNRCGDYLVFVNPDSTGGREASVVVECKARSKVGVRAALNELDRAMANREASAGLMVVDDAAGTALGGQPLRVYPGNRVIVLLDREKPEPLALEIACQLVRELAVATLRVQERAVNLGALETDIARLTDVVEQSKAIAGGVKVARRGIQTIEESYLRLRGDASELLAQISRRLCEEVA